ncbi:MAG: GNAT family N-acetyltransferase [Candidatus Staskawiczbacteria bacterium]|nr:GNAT family N-acetyltransferase [Candidatus Staskawiczbacteria bacterium]
MKIKVIKKFDKKVFMDAAGLLEAWWKGKHQLQLADFKNVLKYDYLICAFDGKKVVAMATLVPVRKLSNLRGSIEHVMVDKEYRGQGLGKMVMDYALQLAKKLKMHSVFLTCDPENVVANGLYKKMGFKLENIHFYNIKLK